MENQKIASKSHVPKVQSKFEQIKMLYFTVEPFQNTQTQAQRVFWVNMAILETPSNALLGKYCLKY